MRQKIGKKCCLANRVGRMFHEFVQRNHFLFFRGEGGSNYTLGSPKNREKYNYSTFLITHTSDEVGIKKSTYTTNPYQYVQDARGKKLFLILFCVYFGRLKVPAQPHLQMNNDGNCLTIPA